MFGKKTFLFWGICNETSYSGVFGKKNVYFEAFGKKTAYFVIFGKKTAYLGVRGKKTAYLGVLLIFGNVPCI